MGHSSFSGPRNSKRRIRPVMEGLEERWVLSQTTPGLPAVAVQSAAGGVFSPDFQSFRYTTPEGTHILIKMVGRGSLEGTTVDSSGALHLLFSKTNAYSKITADVHGGTGRAPLASIYHRDLYTHGAQNSLSGVGGSVIKMINLRAFDLIPGGVVNVTEGINTLALNSVGPATQIQLRELPSSVTAGQGSTVNTGPNNSSSSQTQIISDVFLVQSLAGINGEFVSAGNILLQSDPTNPGPPPAPPGVVIKINHINGNVAQVPNLLTDAKIFGYDPTTRQVLRFSLDLTKAGTSGGTGAVDTTFTPIQVVPADPTMPISLSVGRDGNRLVLLVSAGTNISAYDATFGTSLGSFAAPPGFKVTAMGSTDTHTVIGDTVNLPPYDPYFGLNQLQTIDVAASLSSGVSQTLATTPSSIPAAGVLLANGLTGLPGSNQAYASALAYFDPLQPRALQVGLFSVSTTLAIPKPDGGLVLVNGFQSASQKPLTVNGAYVPAANPQFLGPFLGSVDSNLAFNTEATDPVHPNVVIPNTIRLVGPSSLSRKGSIMLQYPRQLTDLSEAFRPDLNGDPARGVGPALIDVQGNIQSFRGLSANGLVLNDTGYLNLIKTGTLSNSTILAQPIGHVQTPEAQRSNVTLVSSTPRDFGTRGGVTLVPGLNQVGPLSFTNDTTNPSPGPQPV